MTTKPKAKWLRDPRTMIVCLPKLWPSSIDRDGTADHGLSAWVPRQGQRTRPRRRRPDRGHSARLQSRGLRQHNHLGADVDTAGEGGDVSISQANAPRGDELADGRGIIGAVDTKLAGAEIH